MSNSDYIIHGSRLENLIKILQCGYINNKPMKKDIIMLKYKPSNQIFTQLIYRNIPNEKKQKPHWWNCVIVLDKKILKDYPFYATRVGGFTNKFENGKTSEHTIIYGEGNLDRMPNLTKLKNIINKVCETDSFDSVTFTHSNEILFNKQIPLNTYCKCIIMYDEPYLKDKKEGQKQKQNIIELANNANIPIKVYNLKKKNYLEGLNNFIDIIENK